MQVLHEYRCFRTESLHAIRLAACRVTIVAASLHPRPVVGPPQRRCSHHFRTCTHQRLGAADRRIRSVKSIAPLFCTPKGVLRFQSEKRMAIEPVPSNADPV